MQSSQMSWAEARVANVLFTRGLDRRQYSRTLYSWRQSARKAAITVIPFETKASRRVRGVLRHLCRQKDGSRTRAGYFGTTADGTCIMSEIRRDVGVGLVTSKLDSGCELYDIVASLRQTLQQVELSHSRNHVGERVVVMVVMRYHVQVLRSKSIKLRGLSCVKSYRGQVIEFSHQPAIVSSSHPY